MTRQEREKEKRCSECVRDVLYPLFAHMRGGRLRDARGQEGARENTSG